MTNINFFEDYYNAIIETSSKNYPPNYSLETFFTEWCNTINEKLSQYKFEMKIAFKAIFYPLGTTRKPSETEFRINDFDNLAIFINKNKIIDKDNVSEKFEKITNVMLKIIKQQTLAFDLNNLSDKYAERLKELDSMRQASILLGNPTEDIHPALRQICDSLPNAFQHPKYAMVRITYNGKTFKTSEFEQIGKGLTKTYTGEDGTNCSIEVYYKKKFPNMPGGEGQFLPEEHYLLSNLAVLIAGAASNENIRKVNRILGRRIKELNTITKTTEIIQQGKDIDHTLYEICKLLPSGMRYSEYSCARIRFEGKEYVSDYFEASPIAMKEQFVTIDSNKGSIEIFYYKDFPNEVEFQEEEIEMLKNISQLVTGFINNNKGRSIIHRTAEIQAFVKKEDNFRRSLTKSHKPLQAYFNQQMIDKYIYLDMMKYKVMHVLFVATLYDAFVLENEDSFFEKFLGDVHQFSLYTLPRITGVSSKEEAIDAMSNANIDMVIIMPGMSSEKTVELSQELRSINENIPIYLLVNKKEEVKHYEELVPTVNSIDKIFVWSGDSNIFFTIVKIREDSINVENDTQIGLVRVILLIEDSPIYYSKYLEMLYSIVFGQEEKIIQEVEKRELDKIVKMRSRPKILHARNYEEAIAIFNKYKDHLMCVISDVEFDWNGKLDRTAGLKFVKYMRSKVYTVPVIFQSTEELRDLGTDLYKEEKVFFVNKNSDSLLDELKRYLIKYLGFGDFIFRNRAGDILGRARSIREFELMLKEMPEESIFRHAVKNQFSIWLMARGEIQLAKTINSLKMNSINDVSIVRPQILKAINDYRADKKRGKILSFDETSSIDERNIIALAPGSLGGKGRGLAFIDTLIYNLEANKLSERINILAPVTVVIGTDEFRKFISHNDLFSKLIDKSISYEKIRELFYKGHLSDTIRERIKTIISQTDNPLAIRSSSTSEDSVSQPFAGVFDTYIIPNEKDDKEATLELVCKAVKLIYASVYSETARNYYNAVQHNIEEEKMAIIIQEVVGSRFGQYFYPHISGVAQSYNFYPVANMKPEEGYAVAGVGLGCYVVGGWPAYRFSPKYPDVSMYTTNDLLKSTQTKFYALDCSKREIDLLKNGELAALKLLNISDAEKHGSLKHLASVYNYDNDSITPGLDGYGARIVNFANILQYNYFPLAETIDLILNAVKDAFGSPVEIEFAVNLNKNKNGKPSFYLLQIKPMVSNFINSNINIEEYNKDNMLLYTDQSLGNGKIETINDVIFVDESKFTKLETQEMAKEIDNLNAMLADEKRKYVLIGPGRWGSSDRFLGIPVQWSQITNAAVIVETSLENYPLDFSHGSHFFHNITSMNVGYFAVKNESRTCFIHREILENQKIIHQTKYFKHVRFEKPFTIIMNGKKNEAGIILN
ncbi:MAG: pyruvate, phosphate dikinase [Bacteroidales bacterium]|nr:pyruvate, phosphate dikinase [Bacteroidales bacterium]